MRNLLTWSNQPQSRVQVLEEVSVRELPDIRCLALLLDTVRDVPLSCGVDNVYVDS